MKVECSHPILKIAVDQNSVISQAEPHPCDVLVVGGGINGAGIARDLAGRGWRVVLAERDDLASHTSSSSTKLIHGGLRYLEYYEFSLVRKALKEREVLLRSAPHIMWPLRFVMPHDPSASFLRPAWMIRLGLFLYDHLAKREVLPGSRGVDLRQHPAGAPLKPGFSQGFVYSDGWVDDARLVLLCAQDAAAKGARVLTRCAVTAAQRSAQGWLVTLSHADGRQETVQARALVNAAGPWAESFLRGTATPAQGEALATKHLRLVKGSHIVVPRCFEHDHAYIFQNPDKRIIFAIPYEREFTLIGTTDEEIHGDPAQARISEAEVAYLCEQASRYFTRPITPADVAWSYSGVRPLLDDDSGDPSAVTRDYMLESNVLPTLGGAPSATAPAGGAPPSDARRAAPSKSAAPLGGATAPAGGAPLVSVWGGKITTFRKLAEDAATEVGRLLGEARHPWTEGALLPGGDLSAWIGPPQRPDTDFARFVQALQQRHPWLPPALALRWARAYGGQVSQLLGAATSLQGLGAEVAPGVFEAELRHLQAREFALTGEDVLWRRSKLGLHLNAEARQAVIEWMSAQASALQRA
ncbi:glycerol-3-phosphate dehydrogenase [Ideonella paludis]|uniref:Glycerol-3-phosphate dehydrogenase n=1 Tax=Ideonella paludis TaxID=1233411 RepID=A0ABS5DZ44_9BURK|nr:glycerol-3-phosphate dehydrogenase [Ideonella paludis]MBQ0936423.1 glycerol-3-phosphate dehydrogenase [Ideonella paludis]